MVRKGRTCLVRYPSLSVDSIQFALDGVRWISVPRAHLPTFDAISNLAFGSPFGMLKAATDVLPPVKPPVTGRSPPETGVRKSNISLYSRSYTNVATTSVRWVFSPPGSGPSSPHQERIHLLGRSTSPYAPASHPSYSSSVGWDGRSSILGNTAGHSVSSRMQNSTARLRPLSSGERRTCKSRPRTRSNHPLQRNEETPPNHRSAFASYPTQGRCEGKRQKPAGEDFHRVFQVRSHDMSRRYNEGRVGFERPV